MSTMSGYTKLFNSILLSTIWDEDDATRIVWITMLAMADRYGRVEASVPGLVRAARVTREAVEAALVKLESPDRDSRSKEFEGRRIEAIDGGWVLLNHAKYRAKLSQDERREYFKIKKREQRAKSTDVQDVKDTSNLSPNVTQAKAEAEAEAKGTSKSIVAKTATVTDHFEDFWNCYPKKVGKKPAYRAWLRIVGVHEHWLEIIAGVQRWRLNRQWDDPRYIPNPETFLNQRRWEDEVPQNGKVASEHESRQRRTIEAARRTLERHGGGTVDPLRPALPSGTHGS